MPDTPGEKFIGHIRCEEVAVRRHLGVIRNAVFLCDFEEEGRQVTDCLDAIQWLDAKPAHSEVPEVPRPLPQEVLDTLAHFGKHRAALEILVAVGAAKVAIFRGEWDELEDIAPVVITTKEQPKATEFVRAFLNNV